ncbi:MAG: hypothetical protein K0U37_07425 [Gammaproteobacteria bacterium]|nr:hypothetical protein [Gammaproteobacteria bacterium]
MSATTQEEREHVIIQANRERLRPVVEQVMHDLNSHVAVVAGDFQGALAASKHLFLHEAQAVKQKLTGFTTDSATRSKAATERSYIYSKFLLGRDPTLSKDVEAFLQKYKDQPLFVEFFREFYAYTLPRLVHADYIQKKSDAHGLPFNLATGFGAVSWALGEADIEKYLRVAQADFLKQQVREIFEKMYDNSSAEDKKLLYKEISRRLLPERPRFKKEAFYSFLKVENPLVKLDLMQEVLYDVNNTHQSFRLFLFGGKDTLAETRADSEIKLYKRLNSFKFMMKHHEYPDVINTLVSWIAASISLALIASAIAVAISYDVLSAALGLLERTLISSLDNYQLILRRQKQREWIKEELDEKEPTSNSDLDASFEKMDAPNQDTVKSTPLSTERRLRAIRELYQVLLAAPEDLSKQDMMSRFFFHVKRALKLLAASFVVATLTLPLIALDALFIQLLERVLTPLLLAIKLLTVYTLSAPLYLWDGLSYIGKACFSKQDETPQPKEVELKNAMKGLGLFDNSSAGDGQPSGEPSNVASGGPDLGID